MIAFAVDEPELMADRDATALTPVALLSFGDVFNGFVGVSGITFSDN